MSLLSSILSLLKSADKSQTPSSKESESSASSPVQSQGSSNKVSWIAKATDQIKEDEGLVLHVYDDSLGYSTIGYGRLVDRRKGGGISEDEALYLLKNDVNARLVVLENTIDFFARLDDARKAVLLNMSFQLGIAGLLKFKSTLSYIESGDYENASANMLKSLWARQTPNRANRLAEQMRTGTWQYG
jgi:lysozyme